MASEQTPEFLKPHRSGGLDRWALVILVVATLLMPVIIYGAIKGKKIAPTDIRKLLPTNFEEAQVYDQFKARFGVDEMIVASWDECVIDNPAVLEFQDALTAARDLQGPVFVNVTSGIKMRYQIESASIPSRVAAKRLSGLMIGPDKQTTCILAFPHARVSEDRKKLVAQFYQIAKDSIGLESDELHLGGPTVDGAAIDIESKRSLDTYLRLSLLAVTFLAWFRLRDIKLTFLVMATAGMCAATALAALYYSGGQMNLTMVMLPTLIFVLGVSGAIHMVNYYRKAAAQGAGEASADVAIRDGCFPVILSSVTTSIGLCSLATSQIKPIGQFGLYSGVGVLLSMPIVLLVLPAILHRMRGQISAHFSDAGGLEKRERETGVSRGMSVLVNWVCRSHQVIVIPTIILLTLLGTGILSLKASVKLQNRFSPRAQIIADYQWLESRLGPLVPMEIMLQFDADNSLTPWQQMQMVQSIEKAVKRTTAVNASLSAATFEPIVPKGVRAITRLQRIATIDLWKKSLPELEKARLVSFEEDSTWWRISLRIAALNDIDYGQFIETVNRNVKHQLHFLKQPKVTVEVTGGVPLIYKAQRQILRDLSFSFVTAFVLITFVLIFVIRNIRAGLIAMLPNVFPPLMVFGTMGWLGTSIEIGSVMTASVALGVAVDDTIHFLTWFRRGTRNGLSRPASIRFAFKHCAKAMIDTSLICGLGVSPFLFSIFMPTAKFSFMMLVLLMMALVGDLFFLPAILASPLGKLFAKKRKPKNWVKKKTP